MNKKLYIHPQIRKPLILFVLVTIFSTIIIAVSDFYLNNAFDSRESANRAMRLWKNKIDGSRESNRIINEYEKRYLDLVKNNIVGEENRLNWLETIQATANIKGMSSVKYNVSSQRLVEDKTGQHAAQGLKVYRSDMTLDMKMAHEGDLFEMLNTLENKAQGLFIVDKCNIENYGAPSKSGSENMHAYCELAWYTFKSADNHGQK
ncbi:MAG: hypothetical protein OEY66_02635 [Gammaproteobacteria bacterium]|nr:hypothetical protein [Gammaproteobacteria bacterium]